MSLNTYGKEPEQLEAIIPIFNMVLADYPFDKIESAFRFYLRFNTQMPTPADIANIIDRGNKPPFQRSVYISIQKKHPEDRTNDDWAYMRDYDNFHISGKN